MLNRLRIIDYNVLNSKLLIWRLVILTLNIFWKKCRRIYWRNTNNHNIYFLTKIEFVFKVIKMDWNKKYDLMVNILHLKLYVENKN
jgi:hypothetical protein